MRREMTFPEGCQRQPGSFQSLKAFSHSVCHIRCQEAVMADSSEQLAGSSAPEPWFQGICSLDLCTCLDPTCKVSSCLRWIREHNPTKTQPCQPAWLLNQAHLSAPVRRIREWRCIGDEHGGALQQPPPPLSLDSTCSLLPLAADICLEHGEASVAGFQVGRQGSRRPTAGSCDVESAQT